MGTTLPQFDRGRHGGLYDRGRADAWYQRPADPHWFPEGTYKGEPITDLTEDEIEEYMIGWNEGMESGDHKVW